MSPSIEAWLQKAEEDLRLAEAIPDDPLLTGGVAFHAQQCIEKCFKAVLLARSGACPRIHDLGRLFGLVVGSIPNWTTDSDLLDELSTLYTQARYPGDFGLLPSGRPSIDDASRFRAGAKAIYEEARRRLSSDR